MKKIYAWEKWFTGRRIVLVKGRDYRCSQSSMCQQVRNAAKRAGVRVSLDDLDDRIVINVTSSIEPEVYRCL